MPVNSALVFHLAQVPIKSDYTELSQTETITIAQETDNQKTQPTPTTQTTPTTQPTPTTQTTQPTQDTIWIGWFILAWVFIAVLGMIIIWGGKKQISSFIIGKLQPHAGQKGEGFSIPIRLSNVRTKDYFRTEIHGTVYVEIENVKKASSLRSKEGKITQESVANVIRDRFDAAIRQAASENTLGELYGGKIEQWSNDEIEIDLEETLGSFSFLTEESQQRIVDRIEAANITEKLDIRQAENDFKNMIKPELQSIIDELKIGYRQGNNMVETIKSKFIEIVTQEDDEMTLDFAHQPNSETDDPKGRQKLSLKVQQYLNQGINNLGLKLHPNAVVIASIEESNNYNPNNYLDAQVLKKRTDTIQGIMLAIRDREIKTQEDIRKKELKMEKEIREKELNIETDIESEELKFKKAHLQNNQQLEKIKIDHEIEMELYNFDLEDRVEQITEKQEITTMKEIEQHKAQEEEHIQKAQKDIEIAAIQKESLILEENSVLQMRQKQLEQMIERIGILAEIGKLNSEKKRAEKLEEITTKIEMAQVERENEKMASIHTKRIRHETHIIKELAQAEQERYKAVPLSDFDSLIKLIREELLAKGQNAQLKTIKEIVESLAPQPNALGNSNIYTFSHGDGEDMNKLMRSTSGMHLISSLLNSKKGQEWLNGHSEDTGG